jgi:ATP synthase protein I
MSDPRNHEAEAFTPRKAADDIGREAERRIRARRERRLGVWFGLGMFGLVGWSVAVPILAGVAIGWWLDRALPQRFSWTLALLLAGAVLGAMNAWFWITREGRDGQD